MPELDGISALPLLLQKKRDLVVIMVSTLTRRSAEISLRALSLGAADYIPKPETTREATTSVAFRRELIEKIRTLGRRRPRTGAVLCQPGAGCARRCAEQAGAGAARRASRLPTERHVDFSCGRFAACRRARPADRLLDRRTAGAHGA